MCLDHRLAAIDPDRADAFAGRMLGAFNDGSSRPEGNLDHPVGTLLYTISTMHCMTVSLAQGGEGLGTLWGREQAQALLREAGFDQIAVHQLPHDFQNDYYIMRA